MMTIVLVDDDNAIHEQFSLVLPDCQLEMFLDGTSFLKVVDIQPFDIIFLDIYLPDTTGFTLGQRIRSSPINSFCPIVYLSAYTDAVLDLFSTQPYDFLIKPLDPDDIHHLVRSIRYGSLMNSIEFNHGRQLVRVALRDLVYMESRGPVVQIHTRLNTYRTYAKLSDFFLEYPFFRIHQSYLVNLDYVLEIGCNKLWLCDGSVLPISRKYQKQLNHLLLELARGRT